MIVESIFLVLFIIFSILGFFIINKQVSLVKKGEFSLKDRLLTLFYAIVFSFSIMVVIVMAFIFTVKTPEFWTDPSITPPYIHPLAFLLPFFICLLYISIYPLIDFLFIALSGKSSEGLTVFHKFLSKNFINLSKNKLISIIMALILYMLFVLPPFLISLFNIPFLVIWLSWMLIYPIMILTFFGSKGYIAGISNAFYHIPEIKRYSFLNFEDSKRGIKQFLTEPIPYITFGMMLFVFVWAWISLFQTIGLFFTGSLAISTMTSVFVFVTLFFGVIGYFTRFWGRKIKYKAVDIYFSAYLIAAIGINVLINFLIVNSEKLIEVFNFWSITADIIPNYILFSWAAIIEEITMIIFTSYFFLSKKNDFLINLKISKITQCGQNFDPVPLFNFLKNKNPKISDLAEKTLTLMFERIIIRSEKDLNNWKFKYLLLDGLSDPNHKMRNLCYQILHQLSQDAPNIILPWLLKDLESPNYAKTLKMGEILLNFNNELLTTISTSTIFNLIRDPEWRFKILGIKLALKLKLFKEGSIKSHQITELLDAPDEELQLEILNTLPKLPYEIPVEILLKKIKHPNKKIRAKAISNLSRVNPGYINEDLIRSLIPYMKDPSSSVRASIYNLFSKIGKFKTYSITISPFLDALTDADKSVREASVSVLNRFFEENPKSIQLETIISRLDKNNPAISITILKLLGDLWTIDEEKILSTLLKFIKLENNEIKETVSKILVEHYEKSPDLIFQNLISIKEESKFLSKGIVTQTIIKIAKKNPTRIYEGLIQSLDTENEILKLNILNSLDGINDKYNQHIDIDLIFQFYQRETNNNIKKNILQLLSKIAKSSPESFNTIINKLLERLKKEESILKVPLIKLIMILTENQPKAIPLEPILELFSDDDSFMRETIVKILGLIGYKSPSQICEFLIAQALNDEEWNVREASISSIGKIIKLIENKQSIINNLVALLDDKNNWVRRSSMNLLSSIKDLKPSQIPFEKLLNNIKDKDPIVREGSANLLKIYGFKNITEIFDYFIELLGDQSNEVRRSAVNAMVEIIKKTGIKEILSKILKHLTDEAILEIQQSMALILERTVKYENENIRSRAISLLKVRCEMSQDPIICEALVKIKES